MSFDVSRRNFVFFSSAADVETRMVPLGCVRTTGNPYIKDKLTRLAEDGSKKMPNTLKEAVSSKLQDDKRISLCWLSSSGRL